MVQHCRKLLLFLAFIKRYSLLSSRLTALMSHGILNDLLYLFIARVFNIHRSAVLTALFGRMLHMKLLPSRRKFCVHHSAMHQVILSLHSKPRRQGACVVGCNLPPALLTSYNIEVQTGYTECMRKLTSVWFIVKDTL